MLPSTCNTAFGNLANSHLAELKPRTGRLGRSTGRSLKTKHLAINSWQLALLWVSFGALAFPITAIPSKSFGIGILEGITAKIAGIEESEVVESPIFIGLCASRIAQTR